MENQKYIVVAASGIELGVKVFEGENAKEEAIRYAHEAHVKADTVMGVMVARAEWWLGMETVAPEREKERWEIEVEKVLASSFITDISESVKRQLSSLAQALDKLGAWTNPDFSWHLDTTDDTVVAVCDYDSSRLLFPLQFSHKWAKWRYRKSGVVAWYLDHLPIDKDSTVAEWAVYRMRLNDYLDAADSSRKDVIRHGSLHIIHSLAGTSISVRVTDQGFRNEALTRPISLLEIDDFLFSEEERIAQDIREELE